MTRRATVVKVGAGVGAVVVVAAGLLLPPDQDAEAAEPDEGTALCLAAPVVERVEVTGTGTRAGTLTVRDDGDVRCAVLETTPAATEDGRTLRRLVVTGHAPNGVGYDAGATEAGAPVVLGLPGEGCWRLRGTVETERGTEDLLDRGRARSRC